MLEEDLGGGFESVDNSFARQNPNTIDNFMGASKSFVDINEINLIQER